MNITIVGTGYVGLVTGVGFAEMGNNVTCVDIDKEKINKLKNSIIPIYENGLDVLFNRNVENGNLKFSDSLLDVINDTDIVFSSVGTPPMPDGSANLEYTFNVAREFGKDINKYTLFVTKSTVPIGTSKKVKDIISSELEKRNKNIDFDIISNPEFLKEGNAINDFLNPDRVVIGYETERSRNIMKGLYMPFVDNADKLIFTDITSAEMIKYAANAMLATRISFMNEIARLCEKVGANVKNVSKGIGSDTRIGNKFLNAGCGYGGSCFPKDIKALIFTGKENDVAMDLLNAVESINESQKCLLFTKLKKELGTLNDKTIGIWGLAFKPETDDMREAPSITLINQILDDGGNVKLFDPISMDVCKKIFPPSNKVIYTDNKYDAVDGVDALVLVTEWKVFKNPYWEVLALKMKNKLIIDGRNIYDENIIKKHGFRYVGFGL